MSVRSIFKADLLRGTVAVVTGGATGIGRSIVAELRSLGCAVTMAARNEARMTTVVKEMNAEGWPEVGSVRCDVRREDEVINMVETVIKKHGRIDFLVNNGGGQFPSKLEDLSLNGWNAVIETNLTGSFLCMREVFKMWMRENGGSIVNIIMDMKNGYPMMSHSAASRAGVEALSKSLVNEWSQYNININCIAPGIIFSETAIKNYGEAGSQIFENCRKKTPAKRIGTTEEVAAAVCFLLSPAAKFITGQTLHVDGGLGLYHHLSSLFPDHKKSVAFSWK